MKNRIYFFICLSLFFSQLCLAQTGNSRDAINGVSTVQLRVTDIGTNNSRSGNVTENKSIGFFITGMKSEKDARTIENLLNKQNGIYYPRANYNSSYCAFVTLQESVIGEVFLKILLESAGFGINKYSERISKNLIYKKIDKPTAKILPPQ